MPITSQDASPLFGGDHAGTLKLVVYVVLAILLMVSDQKGHFVAKARREISALAGPVYQLASSPARGYEQARVALGTRQRLAAENRALREQNLLLQAQLNRGQSLQAENTRLLQLLESREKMGLKVQLTRLIDLDLDPFRQRVMIDKGSKDGVAVGQIAMDSHGVFGQISEVFEDRARVVLLSDPAHQMPIVFEQAGMRGIARGNGDSKTLIADSLPHAAALKVGDRVRSSGLGGRFPAGLLIGTVQSLDQAEATGMTRAVIQIAARLSQSQELLLLHEVVEAIKLSPDDAFNPFFVGPPTEAQWQAWQQLIPATIGADLPPSSSSAAVPAPAANRDGEPAREPPQ